MFTKIDLFLIVAVAILAVKVVLMDMKITTIGNLFVTAIDKILECVGVDNDKKAD